ncbi:phospholipid/cholesterol/gamma-HCH transport system substrate-binding protein [Saccharicrinis carchari]|uniref:Phospholipid/cholesterol/gamma-HCH transport system substrate-binding protein n=1 Tax=Saccharicrinis carchari TaxID=1168039 RepID=A0A521B2U2_SACCC|nr:MlaD family protein [Saccharicrinis carchari]SMO41417.1 phospholipid/cholesterol/gamma-HCH transport system substrate-binding protein [Saccharicrinis carchari]
MTRFSKEVKLGFTVALALFIFGWGINFLKGKDVFVSGYRVHAIYPRIDGLTEASPVYFKGYRIGSVRRISLLDNGDSDLLVTMTIEKNIDFPLNTVAQIYSLDLMGTKAIRFVYGTDAKLLQPGDTMETSVSGDLADQVSQEMLPLKDKVEGMVVELDSVLTNFNRLLNDENKNNFSHGVEHFSQVMRNLNYMSATIDKSLQPDGPLGNTLTNLDSMTMVLKANSRVLSSVMHNLDDVSYQLAQAHVDSIAYQLNSATVWINKMLHSLDQGEGTLGKLLRDEQLYYNLNETSISLDRLLNDVRTQPKRYVNFSAISFGGGGGKAKNSKDAPRTYRVLLQKSLSPLDYLRGNELIKGEFVKEERDGKYYLYTLGEAQTYEEISVLKGQITERYPDAEIAIFTGDIRIKK